MTSYTSRIERVTDDSTRYERSDGSTTSEPVLRINMAWLPQYAADTLRFLLTRRVDTNPPHVPATFSKELLQRLSRIVIECANRRGEQCLVRLPPDIDDGYLQLNDLFHRMGFWTCVADLGRFDGQPPYWPEGADRTISGDVLAEMETALKLLAGAGEGNAAAEQSAEFPGRSVRAHALVSPAPQEIATTPDEAVRMVGDEWATYALAGFPDRELCRADSQVRHGARAAVTHDHFRRCALGNQESGLPSTIGIHRDAGASHLNVLLGAEINGGRGFVFANHDGVRYLGATLPGRAYLTLDGQEPGSGKFKNQRFAGIDTQVVAAIRAAQRAAELRVLEHGH